MPVLSPLLQTSLNQGQSPICRIAAPLDRYLPAIYKRKAGYLCKAYSLMAANRGRYKIAGVIWYSWRDIPGGIWFDHTGLFTSSSTRSPPRTRSCG